jgi:cell division protein FtsI/penicillin-binding protein 2
MLDDRSQRVRIRFLIGGIVLAGLIVISKLFLLQIVNRNFYKEKAEHQYITPSSNVFDRGNIYFTNKDGLTVTAATVVNGFKLAIVPNQITNIDDTFNLLNKIITLDYEDFVNRASKTSDPYEEIADRISESDAKAITDLRIAGVNLYREKWRFYPGDTLASKNIGFVSYRGGGLSGNYGLEEYYNDVLSRNDGDFYVNFFAEIFANIQSTIFKNNSVTGDVVTSIEPTVQTELERVVGDIKDKWNSDSVGAVVMDPFTGEIVAMASAPTFDLNNFGKVTDMNVYINPFSQNVYEMGSIVKPLVMAGAIDMGVVTPSTTYEDKGSVKVEDKILNNFDKKARGIINMQDVLNQSVNTGMVFIGNKMGKEAFKDYMLGKYKLGEKTGIDLPNEVGGLVGSLKTPNNVNYATATFGQGIATSPINIVRGFAALANGGRIVTPHLATTIIESSGIKKNLSYEVSDPVLKPETISTIQNMLVHVVDDGYHKGMKYYSVAAKTGTAQIAKPNGGGYYDDRNLHSLIGFFPASKPKYVLYIFNVYPKEAMFAIQTLADPFFNMVQFLVNYYQIPPDR